MKYTIYIYFNGGRAVIHANTLKEAKTLASSTPVPGFECYYIHKSSYSVHDDAGYIGKFVGGRYLSKKEEDAFYELKEIKKLNFMKGQASMEFVFIQTIILICMISLGFTIFA